MIQTPLFRQKKKINPIQGKKVIHNNVSYDNKQTPVKLVSKSVSNNHSIVDKRSSPTSIEEKDRESLYYSTIAAIKGELPLPRHFQKLFNLFKSVLEIISTRYAQVRKNSALPMISISSLKKAVLERGMELKENDICKMQRVLPRSFNLRRNREGEINIEPQITDGGIKKMKEKVFEVLLEKVHDAHHKFCEGKGRQLLPNHQIMSWDIDFDLDSVPDILPVDLPPQISNDVKKQSEEIRNSNAHNSAETVILGKAIALMRGEISEDTVGNDVKERIKKAAEVYEVEKNNYHKDMKKKTVALVTLNNWLKESQAKSKEAIENPQKTRNIFLKALVNAIVSLSSSGRNSSSSKNKTVWEFNQLAKEIKAKSMNSASAKDISDGLKSLIECCPICFEQSEVKGGYYFRIKKEFKDKLGKVKMNATEAVNRIE